MMTLPYIGAFIVVALVAERWYYGPRADEAQAKADRADSITAAALEKEAAWRERDSARTQHITQLEIAVDSLNASRRWWFQRAQEVPVSRIESVLVAVPDTVRVFVMAHLDTLREAVDVCNMAADSVTALADSLRIAADDCRALIPDLRASVEGERGARVAAMDALRARRRLGWYERVAAVVLVVLALLR